MVSNKRKVAIDREAKKSLRDAYVYIRKDSLQNADKVRGMILTSIKKLIKNPEHHNPDKFRIGNDGSYRAYEIYKYRITYRISSTEIRVIRIRHTKMNPVEY
ncbi:MAG: type II toxin-antitoxin system RelE/ParE family toxin [Ginsengibacter sp.]